MLTFSEVCDRLRMSPKTLRKLIASGEIEAFRVGGNNAYRISEEALRAYIRRSKVEPVKAAS